MKYQSELINEIIEVRGHKKSSLHYESECDKPWIEEAKGAYPKLCDYEGEWLNYMVENPIGNFPYETITANPTATVSNVVPYEYKSAILTGQTLVNVRKTISMDAGDLPEFRLDTSLMKANTKYSVFVTGVPSDRKWAIVPYVSYTNNQNATFVTSVNLETQLKFYINLGNVMTKEEIERVNITIVEGDVPLEMHFEGMQSVQMPVLTTSNEDGTKSNILTVNEDVTLRGIGEVKDELNCLTGGVTQRIGEIVLDGSDDEKYSINGHLTSDSLTRFVITSIPNNKQKGNIICDLLPVVDNSNSYGIFSGIGLNMVVNCSTVNELRTWLQQNPITVQYELATESVKTVDLTVANQDGKTLYKIKPIEGTMHIESSGTSINPTAVLEVPVEAITQNLNSFIEEE